jgi:hypothetical protein
MDILAISCRKIKPLCENILSTGTDVAGVVNILCWVDEDESGSIIFIFHPHTHTGIIRDVNKPAESLPMLGLPLIEIPAAAT